MQLGQDFFETSELISGLWEDVLARCAVTGSRSVKQSQILVDHVRSLQDIVLQLAGELKPGFDYPRLEQAEALGIDGQLAGQIAEAVRLSLDSYALYSLRYPEQEPEDVGGEPVPWIPDRVEELY